MARRNVIFPHTIYWLSEEIQKYMKGDQGKSTLLLDI